MDCNDTELRILKELRADLIPLFENLLVFVKESTKHFDSSHNHQHAQAVTLNALIIAKSPEFSMDIENIDLRKLLVIAMLHDVCDHKYKELSISTEQLTNYIQTLTINTLQTANIIKIIDSISYSKQIKNATHENSLKPADKSLLSILRDADRIEAIGQIGIQRCYTYTKESLGPTTDLVYEGKTADSVIIPLVVQHCHDKLLRLYNEGIIVTKKGREIAEPLHQEIVSYVLNNTPSAVMD